MSKDNLFLKANIKKSSFEFNQEVVKVFDDMIHRSIPGYSDIIKQQIILAKRNYQPESMIYDLGCSNGNFCFGFEKNNQRLKPKIVAIDSSSAMIESCKKRELDSKVNFRIEDINVSTIENASVVVMNLTLQFIDQKCRLDLIKKIYRGLNPGGIFLLTEKVSDQEQDLENLNIEMYYQFKKDNGYSELEIAQKREALEKVLIPDSISDHLARLDLVGFKKTHLWFRWFNFISLIAFK